MNAQIGAVGKLNQEIIDKKAKVAALQQTRKSSMQIQQLDAAIRENEEWRERYSDSVDKLVESGPWRYILKEELRGIDDPTCRMTRMMQALAADTNYSQEFGERARQLKEDINSIRTNVSHPDDQDY